MIEHRTLYDAEFKQLVISLLEQGSIASIEEARKKFHIGGSMTINKWIRRAGKEDLLPKLKLRTLNDELNQLKVKDPQLYETITKTIDNKK